MSHKEIELILARQLASYLDVPILIVDPAGDLLFFNESAEPIVGRRFDETGVIRRGEWSRIFQPTDDDGTPVPREQQALFIATERRLYRRNGVPITVAASLGSIPSALTRICPPPDDRRRHKRLAWTRHLGRGCVGFAERGHLPVPRQG